MPADMRRRLRRDRLPLLSTMLGYGRFAIGLRTFLRAPILLSSVPDIIRRGMARREDAFLEKVERAIFGNRRSPYLTLLRNAGCELGDVRTLVRQDGVEAALERLRDAGVYVSFEEFKGRAPARRGSQTFVFADGDFDNPVITAHYYGTSGGSRGTPTRIILDLEHLTQMAPHWALWFLAHGVASSPLVFVTPSYPSAISQPLMSVKCGNRYVKWFLTSSGGSVPYRLAAAYLQTMTRWMAGLPRPERVTLGEADRIGAYLCTLTANGHRPCINTSPSTAARIALAAQDRGASLHNVTFLLGGEPLTPARRRTIEAAGAHATVTYGFSEGGNIGSQCATPAANDDIHIALDTYAVIQHDRSPGEPRPRADVLLVTALRPACPKVLLNTDIGDTAVLETRRCGCTFDDLGYLRHLHTVRSSHKLTGEGVTFLAADVVHVLEEVLPRRFGGALTDYQLVEEQTGQGLPRYTLLISPELGALDEGTVVTTFLGELGRLRRPYGFMANQWRETNVLHVERSRPTTTPRGKLLPFRTLGS